MDSGNLISLIKKGFYKDNAYKIISHLSVLIESSTDKLILFTLKSIYKEILIYLDREPVNVNDIKVLTNGLEEQILNLFENQSKLSFEQKELALNKLLSNFYHNRKLLSSQN